MSAIQILGAGLTGLSAAHHLGQDDYVVYEKQSHVGGHAITIEEDGYRFDRTGHLLHLRDPDMRQWVTSLLGDDTVSVQRRSAVFSHGAYTRYPYQANTFGLPPQVAYECIMGFLAAQRDMSRTPVATNFEEFCYKHFGDGFSRHFMVPYNQKLWGVSPKEITAEWCSRFVPIPKLEDVIAGAVGLHDRELGYNTHFLYPVRGIGELAEAMSKPVLPRIRFGHAPQSIDWRARTLVVDGEARRYEALISTVPLAVLVGLLTDAPPEILDAARKLRCNPLWYLDVALEVPCGVPWHWMYIPEEKYPFYRVGCYSHFSDAMAPAGKSNLYVELSSREAPTMDVLLPQVAQSLIEMKIISSPSDIRFARARKLDYAYVVYDHHYYACTNLIFSFLQEHNILSTGRYGGWNYSSMEDALLFGKHAAEQARELVR